MLELFIGVLAGLAPAPADSGGTIPLEYKSQRRWSYELPAAEYTPVGAGIGIPHARGDAFAVELEGRDLRVDTDGDGTPDTLVEGRDVDGVGRVAFVTLTGESRRGQSMTYSARLLDRGRGWEYASSGVRVGELRGTRVTLIDQNNNGRFDELGVDAMIVGRGKQAGYLSEVIAVDGDLLQIQYTREGGTLTYEPYDGPTGTIDFVSGLNAKAKLLSAVLRSVDQRHSFELAGSRDGVKVPATAYTLVSGKLGMGDAQVLVGAGKTGYIRVKPDQSTTFDWGGPVKAEFRYAREGGKVTFLPDQIRYFGSGGEEYYGFRPFGASPRFEITAADTGKEIETAIFGGC